MSNKQLVLVVTLSLVGLTGQNNSIAHELGKGNDSRVVDSSGHLISDNSGDCVMTGSWDKALDLVDCGAAPAQAAVAPEPAPAAEPAPAPVVVEQKISLSAGALFDVNSDSLKSAGKQELSELAGGIKAMQKVQRVNITGHTDSSGAESYNQVLSERRANAVRNYLLEQGVSSTVISTSGMGESQPVASNSTREGRARNRRVEITIEGLQTR